MAQWLLKTEPDAWSWDQQVARGAKGEAWSGVRNHVAKRHLMAMRRGDRAFFYHSNQGREIVGIVEIVREHYPDPTDASGKFVCVDVKALSAVRHPVTLDAVKANPKLRDMALVRHARLSVQPVTSAEWQEILRMAERPPDATTPPDASRRR